MVAPEISDVVEERISDSRRPRGVSDLRGRPLSYVRTVLLTRARCCDSHPVATDRLARETWTDGYS